MHRDPPHYLKALKTTTTPKRLLWLDCAGRSDLEQGARVERWDAGALGSTHYTRRKGERVDWLDTYKHPELLWQAADERIPKGRRAVMFAFDLAYQLRISQALVHLPAAGWKLEKIVLERTASWCLLRNGDRSLLCCDLQSWAPVSFEKLRADVNGGAHVNAEHPAGRKWSAAVAAARVEVVRAAVLEILAWVEAEGLGPFKPTGSGQSYSAFRRRFLDHQLLVHDDVDRLELERKAMWTGRCEAWRHGKLAGGPFAEYDMHAAYATIAHECEVPSQAVGVMVKPTLERLEQALQHYALLADVSIETEIPVVPTWAGERTVWPVGRFRSYLYDPELRLALEHATKVQVHRAWRYRTSPALSRFAGFTLDGIGEQVQVYGLVPARVMKHWSRCLVGRLALRYRGWEPFGTCPDADLRLVTLIDVDEKTATDLLCAGHERLILTDMSESTESLPQIPGWVMSECRRRLWAAVAAVGAENVVYMDTDSLIVANAQRIGTIAHIGNGAGGYWSHKGTYKRLTIHGPRNLELETDRRVAGLPLTARQLAPLEFTGEVMRSIKESMRAGELDCVTSIPRTFHFHTPDLRRQHEPDGRTTPYRLERP